MPTRERTTEAWKAADVLAKIGVGVVIVGGAGLVIAFVLLEAAVVVPSGSRIETQPIFLVQ